MASNHTIRSRFFSLIAGLIGIGSIQTGRSAAMVLVLLTSGVIAAQGIGGGLADRLKKRSTENEPAADSSDDSRSRLRLGAGLSDALKARSRGSGGPGSAADETSSGGFVFGNPPFDLAVLSPLFDPPDPEALKRKGPVLKDQAEQTFRAGDHATALDLMFGHMAAEYDEARPTLQAVKFSRLLRRPVWSIRFGVSMWLRDSGIEGQDPMPIPLEGGTRRTNSRRSQNPLAAAMGNRGGAASLRNALGNSRRTRRPPDRNSDQESNQKINPGGLADALAGSANDPDPEDSEQDAGQAGDRLDDVPPEEVTMLSESVNEELEHMLGMVAQVVGDAFNERYQRGDYGALLIDVAPAEDGETGSAANADRGRGNSAGLNANSLRNRLRLGGAAADNEPNAEQPTAPSVATPPPVLVSPDSPKMWNPGIVHVGNGATKDMIAQARDAGLDVLLHFEVLLKSSRGDSVQNIARVRLINVATGKSIGISKPIDNMDESQSAARGGATGREYVEQRLENLLEILDRDVKVIDLPKLTPEVARRRLGQLMSSQPERSLRTLAEIRLYQMQQLITAEEVEMAFDIVGGNESLMFLYGSASDRAKMARAWATGEAAKKES